MANASPEERKALQAKIHDIDFRMQELKDQAEVRKRKKKEFIIWARAIFVVQMYLCYGISRLY